VSRAAGKTGRPHRNRPARISGRAPSGDRSVVEPRLPLVRRGSRSRSQLGRDPQALIREFLASKRCPRLCRASTGLSTLAPDGRHLRPDRPRNRHDACHPSTRISSSRAVGPEVGLIIFERASGRGFSRRPLTEQLDAQTGRSQRDLALAGRVRIDRAGRALRRPQKHPDG